MGTTSSSVSESSVVNKAVTDVVMSYIQNCSAHMDVSQSVNSSGINLFGSTSVTANVSASCLQNIKMNSTLSNQIAANIQQEARQNNVALLPSYSGSNAKSNIQNLVQNTIKNETLQKCAASLTARQSVNQSGVQIGSNITISASLVSSCISNQINSTGLANSLTGTTKSKTTQTTAGPFDSIINALSNYGTMLLAIGGIIVITGIIGYVIIKRNN